jgi:hypothetical protein
MAVRLPFANLLKKMKVRVKMFFSQKSGTLR